MKRFVALVVSCILLPFISLIENPGEAEASGRRTLFSQSNSSCCYPAYEPSYIYRDVVREVPVAYPVPFTVAVPVVSYLYSGGGYSYAPVFNAQPAAAVGVVAPAPKANDSDTTSLTDAQIDNLITRIEARLAARQQQPNGNGNYGKTSTPPPPAVASDVTTVLTLKRGNDQKACMDCHTGSSAKGNIKIFLEPGKLNPAANWSAIWDATDEGRMPPETKKNRSAALNDQEVQVLRLKMLEGKSGKK